MPLSNNNLTNKLKALIDLIKIDLDHLQIDLDTLETVDKSTLVNALNEVKAEFATYFSTFINDEITDTETSYSSVKIQELLDSAINSLVNESPEAYDTLKEIADWIANDQTVTTQLLSGINTRLRYDIVESLSTVQINNVNNTLMLTEDVSYDGMLDVYQAQLPIIGLPGFELWISSTNVIRGFTIINDNVEFLQEFNSTSGRTFTGYDVNSNSNKLITVAPNYGNEVKLYDKQQNGTYLLNRTLNISARPFSVKFDPADDSRVYINFSDNTSNAVSSMRIVGNDLTYESNIFGGAGSTPIIISKLGRFVATLTSATNRAGSKLVEILQRDPFSAISPINVTSHTSDFFYRVSGDFNITEDIFAYGPNISYQDRLMIVANRPSSESKNYVSPLTSVLLPPGIVGPIWRIKWVNNTANVLAVFTETGLLNFYQVNITESSVSLNLLSGMTIPIGFQFICFSPDDRYMLIQRSTDNLYKLYKRTTDYNYEFLTDVTNMQTYGHDSRAKIINR